MYAYFFFPVPASSIHEEFEAMAIKETPVRRFEYGAIDGSHNLLAQYEEVAENVGRALANLSFAEFVDLHDCFRDKGIVPPESQKRAEK
jgi:hypothetical protein